MNTKKLLLGFLVIILLGGAGYAWLGGFNNAEVKQITTSEIYVVGKEYKGSVKSDKFGVLFLEAGKLVEEKKLAGNPGSIYYNDPEKFKDSINAFIGVVVTDPKMALPAGYELRTLPAGKKAVQGNINAHYLLAPNKLFPAIFNYAKNKNITLQDFFVERYPDERHAEAIVFEQEK
ncbi:GyrI-like domain-containing protein [Adhaeribacter sp. BT258]|uniref:GyrI-like domain-containing protein n=1 Tax=Adhaeribacter terrigena TaxID=2793070 RepID=A0ABS1C293_9BACT|nr:GyrI-like domain-containing protein [Adhaeribacter terrigena]MBK0403439.1 GyrI-like domain-containing protein [Adhaeribacter terrigena]